MKYLVVSNKHHLHHVARWLGAEVGTGEVGLVSLKRPYQERAWDGILKRYQPPKRAQSQPWDEWMVAWLSGLPEVTIITDSQRVSELAGALQRPCYGALASVEGATSALALGGWWDGSALQSPHWVFRDVGLWPGGLGPAELGGVTLVASHKLPKLDLTEALAGFRGLVAVDLTWDDAEGGFRPGRLQAGWPLFHSQLWLWAQPSVAAVLGGKPGAVPAFAVGAPVSVPPYPHQADVKPRPAAAPAAANLVLFDVRQSAAGLTTAGLDGLVALACGKGATLRAAKDSALGAVPAAAELGVRSDVGEMAELALVGLERAGWY